MNERCGARACICVGRRDHAPWRRSRSSRCTSTARSASTCQDGAAPRCTGHRSGPISAASARAGCTRRTVCRRAACGARRRAKRKGRLFSSARRCPKLVGVARVLHSKVAATLHRLASSECARNPPLNAAVTDGAMAPDHRTHASTQFRPCADSVPSLRSIANRGDRENRHVETVSFIASLSIEPNR